MRRGLIFLVAVAVVIVGALVFVVLPGSNDNTKAAKHFNAVERTLAGGTHRLLLNGADMGFVRLLDLGGTNYAPAATATAAGKESPSNGPPDPIKVEIGAPFPRPIVDMVSGLFTGAVRPMNGSIVSTDASGQVVRTEFTNAIVTSADLPGCDGTTGSGWLRLTIQAQTQRSLLGPAGKEATSGGPSTAIAQCRVTIGQMQPTAAQLDGVSVKIPNTTATGAGTGAGQPVISPYTVRVPSASLGPWLTWFDRPDVRTMSIEWMDAGLKTVFIKFDAAPPGVSIMTLRPTLSSSPTSTWDAALRAQAGRLSGATP